MDREFFKIGRDSSDAAPCHPALPTMPPARQAARMEIQMTMTGFDFAWRSTAIAGLTVLALLATGCANAPDKVPPLLPPAVQPVPAPEPQPLAAPVLPETLVQADQPRPPASPRGRLDPGADAERADLWQRVRDGYAMPELNTELVRKWEQSYASKPEYLKRMTERGGRYLFHIVEEIDRRGLPLDLALLPFIESAFNPQAMSVARASGMWQFMPGTGKDFELRQNLFRDDRRDVLASTRAALDYLTMLHKRLGDWHLALAAYNWGQGNVLKAIASNKAAGLPTDYASLRMPEETRNYVPKLQAVKNIVARPWSFAISLPELLNHPYFVSVTIQRDIDAALVAKLAQLPAEDFQQLNPQLNKPVILAAGTPQVLLPYDNANHFVRNLDAHRGPLASWTAWVAPRTLKPADAARMVGMSEPTLREVNRIPPRMLVKVGSTLLVSRGAHATANVPEAIADHGAMALAPEARPLRKVSFKAGKKGDSVAAVARRYGIKPDQVARSNGVAVSAHFKAGQTITVSVPQRVARVAARSAPGKRPLRKV